MLIFGFRKSKVQEFHSGVSQNHSKGLPFYYFPQGHISIDGLVRSKTGEQRET